MILETAADFREAMEAMQLRAYLEVRNLYKRETLELGFGAEAVARMEEQLKESC